MTFFVVCLWQSIGRLSIIHIVGSLIILVNSDMCIHGCDIEMNLTRQLLNVNVYDRSIRPARHHHETTNVSFDASLAQLIDVDEKNQIITTNQWISMVECCRCSIQTDCVVLIRLELVRSQTNMEFINLGQCSSIAYSLRESLGSRYCSLQCIND
jgi:hypothetical protein